MAIVLECFTYQVQLKNIFISWFFFFLVLFGLQHHSLAVVLLVLVININHKVIIYILDIEYFILALLN